MLDLSTTADRRRCLSNQQVTGPYRAAGRPSTLWQLLSLAVLIAMLVGVAIGMAARGSRT